MENIEFRVADMLDLGYADASFDAVVCVLSYLEQKQVNSLKTNVVYAVATK